MAHRVLNSRYELREKIGEGGMAVTWKGQDQLLGRVVAVKVMRDGFSADPEFVTRFRQEARSAASLQHEHIAAVYDFGSDSGTHYIVMEYVPGEDLRRRLKRSGPLPPIEAVEIAVQIAQALDAAHSRGIVHRDIKPANILLTPDGSVKVADFGIARALAAAEDTATGTLLGSAHYVSPEQARGEAVGPQSDIYSLGAVLFEMLTGRPPFQASNLVAVVHKHIYDPPPSLHTISQAIPVEADGILLRCLAKDLSGRYATAKELLTYLQALRNRLDPQAAGPVPSAPAIAPPAYRPATTPVRHRRTLVVSATVIAVVIVLLAVGRGLMSPELVEAPPLVGLDVSSARALAESAGLSLQEGDGVFSSSVERGRVAVQSPEPGERVHRGSGMVVHVSLGSASARVPDVTEMTLAQAKERLLEAGLRAGRVSDEYSPTLPAGTVLASDPPTGADAARRSSVDLVVSKGPEPEVPRPPPALDETISFTVPPLATGLDSVEIVIEASSEGGRSTLYRGQLRVGQSTPEVTAPSARPVTVRVLMDGKLMEERIFTGQPPVGADRAPE